jgi:hypothetical protein
LWIKSPVWCQQCQVDFDALRRELAEQLDVYPVALPADVGIGDLQVIVISMRKNIEKR